MFRRDHREGARRSANLLDFDSYTSNLNIDSPFDRSSSFLRRSADPGRAVALGGVRFAACQRPSSSDDPRDSISGCLEPSSSDFGK